MSFGKIYTLNVVQYVKEQHIHYMLFYILSWFQEVHIKIWVTKIIFKTKAYNERLEVFIMMKIQDMVFWVVTPWVKMEAARSSKALVF